MSLELLQTKFEGKYIIAAWVLCVMDDVRLDVAQQLNDGHRNTVMQLKGLFLDSTRHLVPTLNQMSPICLKQKSVIPSGMNSRLSVTISNPFINQPGG